MKKPKRELVLKRLNKWLPIEAYLQLCLSPNKSCYRVNIDYSGAMLKKLGPMGVNGTKFLASLTFAESEVFQTQLESLRKLGAIADFNVMTDIAVDMHMCMVIVERIQEFEKTWVRR